MILALLPLLQDPAEFLLLRNRNIPEAAAVAEAWRAWQGMEGAPELLLDAPAEELISRAAFERDIAAPAREFLAGADGARVRWIVPVYGIPLGVREQPGFDGGSGAGTERNEAAVDSELALLRRADAATAGWIESPLFDRDAPLGAGDDLLGVIRLDGPTARLAAALPEKAALAEFFGASGESFLDTRGLTDQADGYGERDIHMRSVRAAWERLTLPFAHDDAPGVVDLSGRTLLHYEAWYAGSPSAWVGAPRFRTGAIAVHLHSFAAHTLRDPRANWVAPLLAWGATASCGTVFEPYTVGFPYEGVFWDRLARGWTFGEAAVASSRLLSWQAVFVGDPLWRPYPADAEPPATRRAAFAAALRAWPERPEQELFAGFARAWRGFDARLAAIRDAAQQSDAGAACRRFEELLALCEGWEFDAALGAALEPTLGAAVRRELDEVERALTRDPAARAAQERVLALAASSAALGLGERHAALRARIAAKQDALVEKALERRAPTPRGGRVLERWQELRRAERCRFAARAAEAAAARAALEQDVEYAEPLAKEAEKSLAKELRAVEQSVRRGEREAALARLAELDDDHPPCPAKGELARLRSAAEQLAPR